MGHTQVSSKGPRSKTAYKPTTNLAVGRQEGDEVVEHALEVLREQLVGLVEAEDLAPVNLEKMVKQVKFANTDTLSPK